MLSRSGGSHTGWSLVRVPPPGTEPAERGCRPSAILAALMAMAPPHICRRCRVLVYGRCPTCTRTRERARGSAHARGYTAAWGDYSHRWLLRYPTCGMRRDGRLYAEHSRCVQLGLVTPATCTDHILSMRQGGHQFDSVNLQSLCGDCNRRKNIALEGGFGR